MQRRETDSSTLAAGSSASNDSPASEHHRSSTSNTAGGGDPRAGQHGRKRQKTRQQQGSRDQRRRGGGTDSTARKRKRLLADAAKISNAGEDSLKSFLELITCVQAAEILKASPPNSFVGELLAHLLRLLPRLAASLDGASTFIECLEPFEDLDEFVLPASFYRAIATAKEPPPARGHNWKRKNDRAGGLGGVGAEGGYRRPSTQVTGLQTVRAYLCMNGKDAVECGSRTVVATLTRALLGSWDGSVLVGRELFDQSVLKSPDRSGPVGLGLEVLLQCLVQEDGVFCQAEEAKEATDEEDNRSSSSSSDDDNDGGGDDDNPDTAASSRTSRRLHPRPRRAPPTAKLPPSTASTAAAAAAAVADETRACVTIVGNYVRACGETSASFFRDILPKVLLMGMGSGGGGGGRRRGAGSRRIPRRLAAVLRSLVSSTRSRNSFNMERMVVHTVQEVKGWGDPAAVLSAPRQDGALSALDEDASMGGAESAGGPAEARKNGGRGGGGDKVRRRGLVLACLDVLGPTEACLSLIRREMVDGEAKAVLRSAVPDGLLEYRRTCNTADAEGAQAVLLGALSSLLEDSLLGVRLSAVAAVGEGCSSDCAPAVSLLLKRCLDTAPKVRALAIRLLVDEFRLGLGAAGASLARAVLLPPSPSDPGQCQTGSGAPVSSARGGDSGGRGDGRLWDSACDSPPLLGELLRHRNTLEESDRKRFPRLLRGLVDSVMRGETPVRRPSDTTGCGGAEGDGSGAESNGGDSTPDGLSGAPLSSRATAGAKDQVTSPWHGAGLWEDLAAPAARLWSACRPSGTAQLQALDEVLGEIFRQQDIM